MAICKACGADKPLMRSGMCSACMRAIPPKNNSHVSPPSLVERDAGVVDVLKAQSETIEDLITSIEADRLERISAASLDVEDAPAPSDENKDADVYSWGESFLTAACILIALVGAVLLYGLYRFKTVPPVVVGAE